MSHLKKGPGGHLLKNAAGHLVKECEEEEPCLDCTGSQPAPVITTGECVGNCALPSTAIWGQGSFTSYLPAYCKWVWSGISDGTGFSLQVYYFPATNSWCAQIVYGYRVRCNLPGACDYWADGVGSICPENIDPLECVGGVLRGTFTLEGRNEGGDWNCETCVATVTLG